MKPSPTAQYFTDTLHIVFSEIAYHRYMFPDSFFKTVNFENVKVHSLARGRSIESDQLLGSVDGACDAIAHRCLKTLVIGLSIHPAKYAYIRELYAFQIGYGADYDSFKKGRTYNGTTTLFLRRLTALLRQMEVLAVPIYVSMRMTLAASAPPSYRPPGFMSYVTKDIESYSIYPRCGSARVGKASKDGSSMFMCALCVEGPVQVPPLGSMLCPMPMTLDVDEDKQEVVYVAVPFRPSNSHSEGKQWMCAKCDRHCHFACYGLAENASEPGPMCLVCRIREAGIAGDVPGIRRLAQVRKVAFIVHTSRSELLSWLVKQTACKPSTARGIIAILERIGLLKVDRSSKPYKFSAVTSGDLSAVPLFSSDIRQVWTAVAEA
ncbi:HORMA domain-containing protein 1 [Coemansia sp. BCRC 34301]|nr:HORMA domain-containing protein 1 [Coemansia sp. BCRC 34301]